MERGQEIGLAEAAGDAEDIRDAILKIADAGEALLAAGLTDRALIVLLRDLSGARVSEIRKVLQAIPRLRVYLKHFEPPEQKDAG